MSKAKVLAAFLGGALVGAAAALLLAPKTGAEMREEIARIAREKGLNLDKEELEAFINKVAQKVQNYFTEEEIAEAVESTIEEENA